MQTENILEVDKLMVSYGALKAVDDISFKVKRGSFFAFLGQNGAGKSTTIECIATLLDKDSGTIFVNGSQDPESIRKSIGLVFQENVLDDLLTVKENLLTRGSLYITDKALLKERYQLLIDKFHIREIEDQKFRTLSGGQKRRVELARALFSQPQLLIMDEPTTGLDPETRRMVWQIIKEIHEHEDVTIFLTTHYMEEAANADQVVIISQGKIVAEGTPAELKEKYSRDLVKLVAKDRNKLENYLLQAKLTYQVFANQFHITTQSIAMTLNLIQDLKDNIAWLEVTHGTLDDAFLAIVGDHHVIH
ncbi:ABC transporter ATP-binding protein [Eremococcus coleocola]|uniref:ABC transporter ATP-binding protein n=1 Tax=Eremococcus coleocola TaxID=88132 RepID=UPI00041DA20F|nr:ABC transporter ATP-binding protein [Eremococcus coleocola]